LGNYIAGGIVGTVVGFGIGHGIQGRWSDGGWIFTVGDTAALGTYIAGLVIIVSDTNVDGSGPFVFTDGAPGHGVALAVIGAIAYLGIHIWEIVDIWTGARPFVKPREPAAVGPAVSFAPVPLDDGGALSMVLRF
jgi:hypothetical protein